ncbi:MAG: site-2 protease family protein [Verrucomicrobia bacterium]|nr:site-2 protease family protein [Verrucomicrobiota bacterium]
MNETALIDGLIGYLCFIPILTFHEFAHAWVAMRCGDDTAKSLGRVTLNPIAHIDPIGTVALPLLAVFLSASGSGAASFIIGWGKPVPVNPYNLRNRRADDTWVALAGPVMNVMLAVAVFAIAKAGLIAGLPVVADVCVKLAVVSLFLCFFNLLPIPPLDGSHVVKNFIGMSEETYANLCRFGFIAVIIVIQFKPVNRFLGHLTFETIAFLAAVFRVGN